MDTPGIRPGVFLERLRAGIPLVVRSDMAKASRDSKRGLTPDEQRTASAKKDAAFFDNRRAVEAANLKRTLELRAKRLAHQAESAKAPSKK